MAMTLFDENPYVVIWEMTRSCALKCVHCRAEAIERRSPDELSGKQAFMLMDEIRRFGKPIVVLTGGDPLRRPDLKRIVRYGTALGLRMAVTPSGTDEITSQDVRDLKEAGTARLAVSVDGSHAGIHDAFRGVKGSYDRTMDILRWAQETGLPVQINTTISKHNIDDLDALCLRMESMKIVLWSVFFLVPVGRGKLDDEIGGYEYERVFNRMEHLSSHVSFDIKSTEAPHYRRVLIQRAIERQLPSFANDHAPTGTSAGRAPMGVNDGKGFVFVSHTGEVYPSGFLPISAGNVKKEPLTDVYRRSELFMTIRDYSKLKGKCGACEYKTICGGSRARAFAVHGDVMAPDPFCVHVPKGYPVSEEEQRYW